MPERNDRAIIVVNGSLCARERSSPKTNNTEQWADGSPTPYNHKMKCVECVVK